MSAFSDCEKLTSVFIPKKVYYLEDYIFDGCGKLKEIIVDDENIEFSSVGGVLFNKAQTVLIKYPEGKEGASYTVPDTVIDIEGNAFENCKELVDVTFPRGLCGLSAGVLEGCERLERLIVQDGNQRFTVIDGVLFDKEQKMLLIYPRGRKETKYIIPDGIERIKEMAFSNCKNLETIIFPESLKIIENRAFAGCENIASITLPSGLKGICGDIMFSTFDGCKQLKKVTLSRKTKIGHAVFDDLSVELVYID
jgi:hypothetical protein